MTEVLTPAVSGLMETQQAGPANMADKTTIMVVGAGIIGLSSALRLLDCLDPSSFQVIIVASEWPTSIPGSPTRHSTNYASMWAGAHMRPIPASTPQLAREAAWVRQSVKVFERQLGHTSLLGVTKCKGVELLEAPPASYVQQTQESFTAETGLSNYRRYDKSELPDGVELGFEYDTYCINSPLYCASLLRSFILRGGRCLERRLATEREAFSLVPRVGLVVNASGTGFGDEKCFPIRGQTVVTDFVSATKTVTRQKRDGSWSFIIPRFFGGGTVIGGTKDVHDWGTQPDPSARNTLLRDGDKIAHLATNDGIPTNTGRVIADIVGRRPAREGGMRVEIEQLSNDSDGRGRGGFVVHAYGAGGRGFELSWGVAAEVAGLARSVLVGEQTEVKAKL